MKYGKKQWKGKPILVGKEGGIRSLWRPLRRHPGLWALEIKKNKGITDNIMFGGLYKKDRICVGEREVMDPYSVSWA